MSRRRYISTDISLDRQVSRLSDFACLLYTWLIPHASDDCSIQRSDDIEELAVMVMPFRRDKTVEEFATAVDSMLELGLLLRREDGLLCLPAEPFYRYQTYISAKHRPTPINADKRRQTPQNTASLSLSPSLSKTTSSNADAFDAFWSLYPRKVGKKAAKAKFITACRTASPDSIIAGLKASKFDLREGGQFVPHPATWLNQGRWEDETSVDLSRACFRCDGDGVVLSERGEVPCTECQGTGRLDR